MPVALNQISFLLVILGVSRRSERFINASFHILIIIDRLHRLFVFDNLSFIFFSILSSYIENVMIDDVTYDSIQMSAFDKSEILRQPSSYA